MPAYNAALTVERTVRDIPRGCRRVILVDDGSHDRTVDIARALGLTVIEHERNLGYGGNQKTCYRAALERGADIVIMLHPDYQYDSRAIPYIVGFRPARHLRADARLTHPDRREALEGGMPLLKYLMNRVLTLCMNVVLGQNLGAATPASACTDARCSRRSLRAQLGRLRFDAESWRRRCITGSARRRADAGPLLRGGVHHRVPRRRIYTLKIFRVLAAYLGQRMGLRRSPLFVDER